MKRKNVGSDYSVEREIAALLHMQVVPQSGSNWEKGKEDIVDDKRLGQIKSTGKINRISIRYEDIWQLCDHAEHKHPIFVLNFNTPIVRTKQGAVELSERSVWVAIPYETYNDMYSKQQEKGE